MKIALTHPRIPATEGGGHTFYQEILAAIGRISTQTRHQFVAVGWDAVMPTELKGTHIEYKSLQEVFSRSIWEKVQRRLSGKKNSDVITDFLRTNQVEMIVDFSTANPLSEDIPFVNVVWDLQHRVQPYFPEVSVGGEWDRREQRLRRCLPRAAAVIVGTKVGGAEVERFYGVYPDRIWVLPLPTPSDCIAKVVDPAKTEEIRERFGHYILYPAQYWSHKNHVAIVDALEILQEKHNISMNAVFVGSDKGNKKYVLDYAKEKGIEKRIHDLGFVPRGELLALYRAAFALTFVTHFGPDNIPPLEAFALGCPVVASRVSGSEEQLGEAALLVDPKEPRELAEAVAQIHGDDDLRRRLVNLGRARAEAWTADHFAVEFCRRLDDFEKIRRCWR
jgi:glycosyltransferase involved in cell wall biosynthesis